MAIRKSKSENFHPLSLAMLSRRVDKTYDEFIDYLKDLGYEGSAKRTAVLEPIYASTVLNSLGALA